MAMLGTIFLQLFINGASALFPNACVLMTASRRQRVRGTLAALRCAMGVAQRMSANSISVGNVGAHLSNELRPRPFRL